MSTDRTRFLVRTSRPGRWRLALLVALVVVGVGGREATAQVNGLRARTTAAVGLGTGYQNVTGLTWYVAANASYTFSCHLAYTVTGGAIPGQAELYLAVNGPASPTALRYSVTTATSNTSAGAATRTAYDSDPNHSNSGAGTALPAVIHGTFENGPNAGTFAIRGRTNSIGGSTANVLQGSFCTAYRQ